MYFASFLSSCDENGLERARIAGLVFNGVACRQIWPRLTVFGVRLTTEQQRSLVRLLQTVMLGCFTVATYQSNVLAYSLSLEVLRFHSASFLFTALIN